MDGQPNDQWGKLRFRDASRDVAAWHPLRDHCLDVAAVVLALLETSLLGERLATLAELERLSPRQCLRLAWLAFLHDVGKANAGFQAKARSPSTTGHVAPAGQLLTQDGSYQLLKISALQAWFGDGTLDMLSAAIGHHGVPVDLATAAVRFDRSLWPAASLRGVEALAAMADGPFAEAFLPGEPLPLSSAFAHAFAGLVCLADWIASDDAAEAFPYSQPGEDRWLFARPRALEVVAKLGLDTRHWRYALTGDVVQEKPWPLQTAIMEADLPAGGTVVLAEAETGSGKTEAALIHFFRLFAAGLVDGLYFALPTRAAAVQIHSRIEQVVLRMLGEDHPQVVLAIPGYLRVDEVDGKALSRFEVLWPDDDPRHQHFRRWAAENPKRYLAAPIAVGTIDQVLLAALQVKHAHLRGTALLRHLLVIDEVHASDSYMTALTAEVLGMLRQAGGHALLMSATLGSAARSWLFAGKRTPPPPRDDAVAVPYPALTVSGRPVIPCAAVGSGKQVVMETLAGLDDPAAVAAAALEAARRGARVLVIRNKVDVAIATQQAVETLAGLDSPLLFRCRGVPTLHHSRFAPADRKSLDGMINQALGKGSHAPVVVVTTQTAEQSLDIDADLLLCDLCPIDVLLQRIGRLHRHDRPRPEGFATPCCWVVVPAERDLAPLLAKPAYGFGIDRQGQPRVYPDLRTIEACWRLIEAYPRFDLPAMNRRLVEDGTHPDALASITTELGGAWDKHQSEAIALGLAQSTAAILGGLNRNQKLSLTRFPDQDQRLTTRLGTGDRLVTFAPAAPGPFDQPVTVLTISAWMCGGIPADAEPKVSGQNPLTFSLGEKRFVYDRLGLKRVPARAG